MMLHVHYQLFLLWVPVKAWPSNEWTIWLYSSSSIQAGSWVGWPFGIWCGGCTTSRFPRLDYDMFANCRTSITMNVFYKCAFMCIASICSFLCMKMKGAHVISTRTGIYIYMQIQRSIFRTNPMYLDIYRHMVLILRLMFFISSISTINFWSWYPTHADIMEGHRNVQWVSLLMHAQVLTCTILMLLWSRNVETLTEAKPLGTLWPKRVENYIYLKRLELYSLPSDINIFWGY